MNNSNNRQRISNLIKGFVEQIEDNNAFNVITTAFAEVVENQQIKEANQYIVLRN